MTAIVCLFGSPRPDGNSTTLAEAFCRRAERPGVRVARYRLADLRFRGCSNLFRCKTDLDHCGQEDALTPVLAAIASADIIVLATPIYFTDVSAQTKACLDRWFSFFVPDYVTARDKSRLPPGKTLVFVQTQGEPEDQYTDTLERYTHSFALLGIRKTYRLRACGVREPGDVAAREDAMQEARTLAETLVGQPPPR